MREIHISSFGRFVYIKQSMKALKGKTSGRTSFNVWAIICPIKEILHWYLLRMSCLFDRHYDRWARNTSFLANEWWPNAGPHLLFSSGLHTAAQQQRFNHVNLAAWTQPQLNPDEAISQAWHESELSTQNWNATQEINMVG